MSATTWLIIAIIGFSLSGLALVTAVFMFLKLNIPAVIGDLSGKTVAREIRAIQAANATADKPRASTAEKPQNMVKDSSVGDIAAAKANSSKRLDRDHRAPTERKKTNTESFTSNTGEIEVNNATAVLPQERMTDILVNDKVTENLSPTKETEVLSQPKETEVLTPVKETEVLSQPKETEVLTPVKETEILSETKQTEVLSDGKETAVLSEVQETEVLSDPTTTSAGTAVLSQNEVVMPTAPITFKVTRSIVETHTDEVI